MPQLCSIKTSIKMKKIIIVAFLVISAICLKAQNTKPNVIVKDSIYMYGGILKGYKFAYRDTKNVEIRRLRTMLNIDKENATYLKKAKTSKIVSTITGVVGGVLVGFSTASFIAGADINRVAPITIAGGALIAISIPLSIGYGKNMRKAVGRFNQN